MRPAYTGRTNIYDIIESHYWRAIIVDSTPGCRERSLSTSAAHAATLNGKVSATQGEGRWRNISEDSKESGPESERIGAGDIDSHQTCLPRIYVSIHERNAWYFFSRYYHSVVSLRGHLGRDDNGECDRRGIFNLIVWPNERENRIWIMRFETRGVYEKSVPTSLLTIRNRSPATKVIITVVQRVLRLERRKTNNIV